MTRLFIVRHGNTFERDEEPRRIGVRTDIPLTSDGRRQAEALGRHFKAAGVRFDRALCGPLLRTLETARAIVSLQGAALEIEIADFLAEIDHGVDENQPEGKVVARIGGAALASWEQTAEAPDGWIVDRDRRIAAWQRFAAATGDGVDLLVTSNGAARFALLAWGIGDELPSKKLRTGSYGIVEVGANSAHLLEWDKRPT